jgi:hypothetical protein
MVVRRAAGFAAGIVGEQNSAYAGRNHKPSAAIPAQESPPFLFHLNLLLEPGPK